MNKSRNMEQNSKGMTRRMSQAVRDVDAGSSRTVGTILVVGRKKKTSQSVPDLLTSSTDRSVKQSGSRCRDRPEDCSAPVHDHTCVCECDYGSREPKKPVKDQCSQKESDST